MGDFLFETQDDGVMSVCDLIRNWTAKQPNHTAVLEENGRCVSYRDLDIASTRIAWLLQQNGIQLGDLVPVLANRSPEMIAVFLGILKAGACYVPIDIEAWGEDRIESTLQRVSARVVVDLSPSVSLPATKTGCKVISSIEVKAAFDMIESNEWGSTREIDLPRAQGEDLAYIIFTSGTTSAPKGVMIPHRALLNYVQQGTEEAPFNTNATPNDTTLLIFSPGFDACTGLVFSTLCSGAQILIPSTPDFFRCIPRVTILTATPSILAAIQDPETCPVLRTIVLGGEAPPPWLIEKWSAPGRNIYNAYGPTETTVCSLMGRVFPGKPITLGVPMPNSKVLLLDDQDRETDQGEICITGPGLALGYFQDETKTAKSFVTRQGERMYRTGDFARRTEHGLIFGGRADSLVKNRGFLVNLESEVIPMLLASGAATATAFMHRNQLVAFITPDSIDALALRQSLVARHDAFLVPDQIRSLPALPLTANGKADNRALQQLLDAEMLDNGGDADDKGKCKMDILKDAIVAATSLPRAEIDSAENRSFWELGGNSLAALKVLSYLRKRGLVLGIKALLELPTLRDVHDALQETDQHAGEDRGIPDGSEPTTAPMTPLQVKMIQATLKTPGANYLLMRIDMPHSDENPDPAHLKQAWQAVFQRHSIFRTTFSLGQEQQEIRPELGPLDWDHQTTTPEGFDALIATRSDEIRLSMLSAHLQEEDNDKFTPVNIFRLVTVPRVGSTLLASAHHAQADGWSLAIVLEEVRVILEGNTILPPVNVPFSVAALAQKDQEANQPGVSFWTDLLEEKEDSLPILHLPKPSPSDLDTAPQQGDWSQSSKTALGLTISELEDGARRLRVTPSSLVYTAWALVLSNYTSSDRVAFGAVFSGRNLMSLSGVERVVGPLLNTVPFPVSLYDGTGSTIAAAVSHVNSQVLQAVEYQWSAAEVMTSMSGESIHAALQSIVVTEYDLPSHPSSWRVQRQDLMEFGLSLLIERDEDDASDQGGLQVRALFDGMKYAAWGIRQLLSHVRNALRELLNPENKYLRDVRGKVLGEGEDGLLLGPAVHGGHDVPSSLTVKDAFEAAAAQWPDLCAVESARHGGMSYRQLDEASNMVARWLRQWLPAGKRPQDMVVGVITDGSVHWVVAILAAFKAGYVCCAIDASLPSARIQTIIEQSGASVFLAANQVCAESLPGSNRNVLVVDEFLQQPARGVSSEALRTVAQPYDVVYLVFTSGSTGIPKGVPLHNRSILNVIANPHVRLFASPNRRIAQLYGLGFDVVLVELFGSLCYGATLVLKDPSNPFAHLQRVNATMATPSLLSACLPDEYPNLDTIALAGEPVPQTLADSWSHRVRLFNFYGPSECAPISTTASLAPGEQVNIGVPLPSLSAYVLDHHMFPVPAGVVGEIYLSGEQLTRGYWNPDVVGQANRNYMENPFGSVHGTEPIRMYRTGDLGYWDGHDKDRGKLCYVGRRDNQIKVRGFRIELEEIERALIQAGKSLGVKSTAVAVVSGSVVGYVTPEIVDTTALRGKVAGILPSYARPSRIVALSEMPKSANFKIDRKALALLANSSQAGGGGVATARFDSALTDTEGFVASTWKTLLGLDRKARLNKEDDFLALGGNSILAIRAARQLASMLGHHVPVSMLIRETILENLARAIDEHTLSVTNGTSGTAAAEASFSSYWSKTWRATPANYSRTALPLSHLETDMYNAHISSDVKSAFNTSVHLVLEGELDVARLSEAFAALLQENPILRARYVTSPLEVPARVISSQILEPRVLSHEEIDSGDLQRFVDGPFDLARGQLVRVVLITRPGGTELVMVTHHIVTDKASLSLMLQWVARHYRSLEGMKQENDNRGADNEAVREATYVDWAQWPLVYQLDGRQDGGTERRKRFWQNHLATSRRMLRLEPPATSCSLPHEIAGGVYTFTIPPPSQGDGLLSTARGQQQSYYSQRVALTATALALSSIMSSSSSSSANPKPDSIALGIPYMNRDDAATADMLGLFVDQLPVVVPLNDDPLRVLAAVEQEINSVLEHHLPYPVIRYALASEGVQLPERVEAMVLYHWQSDSLQNSLVGQFGAEIAVRERKTKPKGVLFSLMVECSEGEDGGLEVELEYDTRILSAEKVNEFGGELKRWFGFFVR
ncbi:putative non-ribosomal peptide synthetase SirP [Triangularia verruculosa]|uniref:Non-ribosomal peptide synthetase SirP n=1 Tax=Triangularia verruculosa TaxID=2587418 RepID=A0AAN7AVR0_9PEZI|nr:putative non-ribosomal peptide synthetase SirP [Triangularia verruculosa]